MPVPFIIAVPRLLPGFPLSGIAEWQDLKFSGPIKLLLPKKAFNGHCLLPCGKKPAHKKAIVTWLVEEPKSSALRFLQEFFAWISGAKQDFCEGASIRAESLCPEPARTSQGVRLLRGVLIP